VLVTLRTMQDLYGLGSGVHGINVRLAAGEDPDEYAWRAGSTGAAGDGHRARRARGSRPTGEFPVGAAAREEHDLLPPAFIIIVAAFSVTSSLLIAVVRKTREIGLLGALGARRGTWRCVSASRVSSSVSWPAPALGLALGFGVAGISATT
jgi:lipoprotein-releasing system permease protein